MSNFFSRLLTCFTLIAFLRMTGLKGSSSSSSVAHACMKPQLVNITHDFLIQCYSCWLTESLSNNITLLYHAAAKSCRFVLLVELRFTVVVVRVASSSVVGIFPPLSQRKFLFFHTKHFLYKSRAQQVTYYLKSDCTDILLLQSLRQALNSSFEA